MLVEDIPALRNYWYPVAYADEVNSKPHAARVLFTDIVVWRTADDSFAASTAVCAHRGAPLDMGWVEDGCLVCPYHGWRYDSDGRCVSIPSAGPGATIPKRAGIESYPARERYGLVWINLNGTDAEPIPEFAEAESPDFIVAHELMEVWNASAPQILENALDVSHVAWVHRDSAGSSAAPEFGDEFSVDRTGSTLTFAVEHTARVTVQKAGGGGGDGSELTQRVSYGVLPNPFAVRIALVYPDTGLIHVLFKTATPVDNENTLFCQFIARNDRPEQGQMEKILNMDRRVQSEDRALLERIAPDYPLDVTAQFHTKADKVTLEYRRALATLSGVE